MDLLGKLEINYTSNIGILPSSSKDISVKIPEKCLHILTNNDHLNGLKSSTKMQEKRITIYISIIFLKFSKG